MCLVEMDGWKEAQTVQPCNWKLTGVVGEIYCWEADSLSLSALTTRRLFHLVNKCLRSKGFLIVVMLTLESGATPLAFEGAKYELRKRALPFKGMRKSPMPLVPNRLHWLVSLHCKYNFWSRAPGAQGARRILRGLPLKISLSYAPSFNSDRTPVPHSIQK